MYATTQPLSRVAAVIPPLSIAHVSDWPGTINDDPAYLSWLEEQADISAMRTAALWDSTRPGLSLVGSHAFAY